MFQFHAQISEWFNEKFAAYVSCNSKEMTNAFILPLKSYKFMMNVMATLNFKVNIDAFFLHLRYVSLHRPTKNISNSINWLEKSF